MTQRRPAAVWALGVVCMASGLAIAGCSSSTGPMAESEPRSEVASIETTKPEAGLVDTTLATPPTASIGFSLSPVEAAVRVAEAKEEIVAGSGPDAEALVRGFAHPGSADALVSGVLEDLERRDQVTPAGLKLRVAVIETMLMSASDTEASVALWTAEFVTGAGNTRVTYNTIRYDLAVHDDRWLLVAESSSPGPIPTPIQEPSDPSAFEAALVGFNDDHSKNESGQD